MEVNVHVRFMRSTLRPNALTHVAESQ